MSDAPSTPADPTALREALAEALYNYANVLPPILWPPHSRPRTVKLYRDRADALIAGPLATLLDRLAKAEGERDEARRALERDRSIVAVQLNKMRDAISGRAWLLEGGRGPYSWDDDRFREEFSQALREIDAPVEQLRAIARDWSNCPTDQAEIDEARAAGTAIAERDALQAQVARMAEALKPFAAIEPSSFYAADGSDGEGYTLVVGETLQPLITGPISADLTGLDLARARAALKTQEAEHG